MKIMQRSIYFPTIFHQKTLSLTAIILLILLSVFQHSHAVQSSDDDSWIDPDLQCQPLTFEPCKDFGYASVRMPNVFGHPNQEDAKVIAIQLLLLNNTKCSDEYVFYICQMLFPLCLTKGAHNYDKPILPCRSMCNRVYDSCNRSISEAKTFLKNEWPQQLECYNLEVENPDSGVCHDPNYNNTKQKESQHPTTNQQSSKPNNNRRLQNKTKPNKQSSNDSSDNPDIGWDPVRQPFEPPKYPVDDARDTTPLDITILMNPQTIHSSPINRFTVPRPPSSTPTNDFPFAAIDNSEKNIDHDKHRSPIDKHNLSFINNVQHRNGETPITITSLKSLDRPISQNDETNIFTTNYNGLSSHNLSAGNQCDCSCRAPLVPIVDVLDRRYHNRVRVGFIINCAYPCAVKYRNRQLQTSPTKQNSMNIFLTGREQQTLNTVVSILAWTCLTLTGLTIATFLSDIHRFKYPGRCIVFLCACYLLVSSGYLLRSPIDTSSDAHDSFEELATSSPNLSPSMSALQTILDQQQQPFYCYQNLARYPGSGTVQLRCLATFFLTYTFMMAANVWWIIFAIVSFMSSLGWAQESLSSYSQCFHLTAWLVPLIISIVILATEAIDADIQLAMCSVGNLDLGNLQAYIIIPQIAALAIGFLFVSTQFVSLIRRRNLIRLKNSCDKSSTAASISNSPPSSTQVSPTGYVTDENYQAKASISKQALTVNVGQSGGFITSTADSGQLRYLEKLDGSIIRIVLFCLLYFIPILTLVACLLYDQYSRPIRERQYVCPCSQSNQSATSTTSVSSFGQFLLSNISYYEMLLAKHVSILSVGITASLWLCLNMKTLRQWRKLVRKIFRCCGDATDNYNDILGFDVDAIYNHNNHSLHTHQNQQNHLKQQHLLQQRSIFLPADKNSTIASSRSLVRDNIIVNGSQNTTPNHYHRQLQLIQQKQLQQREGLDLADMNHQAALMSSENGSTIVGSTINQYDEINNLGYPNMMNLSSKQPPYNYRLPPASTASTSRVDALTHTSNLHKQYLWMGSGASHNQHHHHHSSSQSSSVRGHAPSYINKELSGHNSRRD